MNMEYVSAQVTLQPEKPSIWINATVEDDP